MKAIYLTSILLVVFVTCRSADAGLPAARIYDFAVCPLITGFIPHVGGPIAEGLPTVLIRSLAAARVGDFIINVGPPDIIATGSATVLIGGKPAARLGDSTAHGGSIVTVSQFRVLIGP